MVLFLDQVCFVSKAAFPCEHQPVISSSLTAECLEDPSVLPAFIIGATVDIFVGTYVFCIFLTLILESQIILSKIHQDSKAFFMHCLVAF